MKILLRHTALTVLLCALSFICPMYAQTAAGEQNEVAMDQVARTPVFNRFALNTNAIDWLAVIPNVGVEYQLTDDPYKFMTVGLNLKYNWNTYHGTVNNMRYSPSTVYDVLDIRPEFRYYFRTIPKPKSKIEQVKENRDKAKANLATLRENAQNIKDANRLRMYKEWIANAEREVELQDSLLRSCRRSVGEWFMDDVWTVERKDPRIWRTYYIGAYACYADYAFKLGARGIRGNHTFGLGLSMGYVLPLYEYRKGAVDVDLGFSVGIQMAKHEVFTHNMDGNFYTKVQEGKSWYGTEYSSDRWLPYPVVSELRVAFVWRKQSIKYEAKMDEATIKKKREYERTLKLLRDEMEKVMPIDYKVKFDQDNKDDVRRWKKTDTLYFDKFASAVQSQKEDMLKQVHGMTGSWDESQLGKFLKTVDQREVAIMKMFAKLREEEKRAAARSEKEAADAKKKDEAAKQKAAATEAVKAKGNNIKQTSEKGRKNQDKK